MSFGKQVAPFANDKKMKKKVDRKRVLAKVGLLKRETLQSDFWGNLLKGKNIWLDTEKKAFKEPILIGRKTHSWRIFFKEKASDS